MEHNDKWDNLDSVVSGLRCYVGALMFTDYRPVNLRGITPLGCTQLHKAFLSRSCHRSRIMILFYAYYFYRLFYVFKRLITSSSAT